MADPRDELPDPLAAQRAALDQAIAEIPEMARAARAVFDGFEGQGFTAAQALYLTAIQLVKPPFPPP